MRAEEDPATARPRLKRLEAVMEALLLGGERGTRGSDALVRLSDGLLLLLLRSLYDCLLLCGRRRRRWWWL
jgi:hypothetical protein